MTKSQLGILGGGQLARMMLPHTRQLDISTAVLDPSMDCPSARAADRFVQGSLDDYDTVLSFGMECEIVTIEFEKVNLEALYELKERGVSVYPQPEVIAQIKNKSIQKEFYKRHHIPTAHFHTFETKRGLSDYLTSNKPALPMMWKAAEGGYDGKGVRTLRTMDDLDALPECACLIEERVDFETELSVIVARNHTHTLCYPTVEMMFDANAHIVTYTLAPARVSAEIDQQARDVAIAVAEAYGIRGLLAVEMFLTKEGKLLVNECAPRVHNSGHWTQQGCLTSQFEQHIRCVLNLPLGSTHITIPTVMANLLGNPSSDAAAYSSSTTQALYSFLKHSGVHLHLYGKKQVSPYRKMGHINLSADDVHAAYREAKRIKADLREDNISIF